MKTAVFWLNEHLVKADLGGKCLNAEDTLERRRCQVELISPAHDAQITYALPRRAIVVELYRMAKNPFKAVYTLSLIRDCEFTGIRARD